MLKRKEKEKELSSYVVDNNLLQGRLAEKHQGFIHIKDFLAFKNLSNLMALVFFCDIPSHWWRMCVFLY